MSHRSLACALSLALSVPGVAVKAGDPRPAPPLPTEAARWVGEPASWASLRGKVTLVFVWTFG
jgi:hypothetical protein